MLFTLDGEDIGKSYGSLSNAAKFVHGVGNSMAYWCNESGSGRFTPLVAGYAISVIRKGAEDPNSIGARWAPLNKRYADWKSAKGYNPNIWNLSGSAISNIGVIYRGRHEKTIGIRRDVQVPYLSYSKKARPDIRVALYAKWMEFGTSRMPARPLFGPGIRTFVSQHFPGMVEAVDKAIARSIKAYSNKYSHSSSRSARSTSSASSGSDFPDPNLNTYKEDSEIRSGKSSMNSFLSSRGVSSTDIKKGEE